MLTTEQREKKEFLDAMKELVKEPRYTLAFSTGESSNTVIEAAKGTVILTERLKGVLKKAA